MIKKKYLLLLLIMALAVTAFSCGVPQKDYDTVQQQLAALQKDNEAAKAQITAAQNETKNLQGQLAT